MSRAIMNTVLSGTVPDSLSHYGLRKMIIQPKRLLHCLRHWRLRKRFDWKNTGAILNSADGDASLGTRSISGSSSQPEINPLTRLQPFVATPIIPEDEVLFNPTKDEILAGQNLFTPGRNHKIEFLKSAVYTEQLPQYDMPEVAFIGRSNVGKSSLIRAILGEVDVDVRISKKPLFLNIHGGMTNSVDPDQTSPSVCTFFQGHTKTLNFYKVGNALTLVDMPGYGYNMPKHFSDSVEVFLKSRRNLRMTYLLTDGSIGMKSLDEEFATRLAELEVKFCIVMTKIDKAQRSRLLKNFMTVLKFREEATYCFYQPFLTSAYSSDGVALLQTFIGYVTGNLKIEGL